MKLFLVEDDIQLVTALKNTLKSEGFVVTAFSHGLDLITNLAIEQTDAIVLDLGLPDIDGIDVLKMLKRKYPDIPVLILTARNSLDDKIAGLDLGAEDYLTKPFAIPELLARLRVIERRQSSSSSSQIDIKGVLLDINNNTVEYQQQALKVSQKELAILKSLMENAGRIQSRSQLEAKLYEWSDEIASNAIEVHIHNLRKKLPEGFITNVRGIGYSVHK